MASRFSPILCAIALCVSGAHSLRATELIEAELKSNLVPKPVPYAVLLPDGFQASGPALPLLLYLHGGGGDRSYLTRSRAFFEELWRSGKLPRMVVATPSVTSRCFYMDYKDGAEKWETFLTSAFREHLQQKYNTSKQARQNLLAGISMGGMGSLRIAFKHPEMFGGVSALEPGIEPILKWQDMQPRHRFWREDSLFWAAFGKPVDPLYWEQNNPASIAQANPGRLRASGLQIYLDCGDEDMFLLNEGTEFLHRILTDNGVKHEYHLVRGADHLGRTVRPRTLEALSFLERVLNPPPPDPGAEPARKQLAPLKEKVGVK
jgi:S-formylglutathione hydrolase